MGLFDFFKPSKEKVLKESVDEIVRIYSRNPRGFIMRSPESQPLRDIGQNWLTLVEWNLCYKHIEWP